MAWDWDEIEFKGEKRFLSNMYPCKIIFSGSELLQTRFGMVDFDNEEYGSTEHLYQALKSKNKLYHKLVREAEEPRIAKKMGKKNVKKGLLEETEDLFMLREDWDDIKVDVMKMCIYLKFTQNEDLAQRLSELQGDIIERNCWGDTFWGTVKGNGENHLGEILMTMRDFVRSR